MSVDLTRPPWWTHTGRKKGVKNKLTVARLDVAAWARSVIMDPEYRARVKAQAVVGTLSDVELRLLYEYGLGKPDAKLILQMHQAAEEEATYVAPEEAQSAKERLLQLAREAEELEGDTVDAEVVASGNGNGNGHGGE
jgi:hypothetical protein